MNEVAVSKEIIIIMIIIVIIIIIIIIIMIIIIIIMIIINFISLIKLTLDFIWLSELIWNSLKFCLASLPAVVPLDHKYSDHKYPV